MKHGLLRTEGRYRLPTWLPGYSFQVDSNYWVCFATWPRDKARTSGEGSWWTATTVDGGKDYLLPVGVNNHVSLTLPKVAYNFWTYIVDSCLRSRLDAFETEFVKVSFGIKIIMQTFQEFMHQHYTPWFDVSDKSCLCMLATDLPEMYQVSVASGSGIFRLKPVPQSGSGSKKNLNLFKKWEKKINFLSRWNWILLPLWGVIFFIAMRW